MLKVNFCFPIPPGIDASKRMKICFYCYFVQQQSYSIFFTSICRVSLKALGLHRSRGLKSLAFRNLVLANNI